MLFSNGTFTTWYDLIKDAAEKEPTRNFDRTLDFDFSKENSECFQAASIDSPCCFLIKAASSPNIPTLVHSPIVAHHRTADGSFAAKAAVHSGVLATTAQVLGVETDEFLAPLDVEERDFADLAKCSSQDDFTAICTQGRRNSPKVGNIRKAIYVPADLAVEFIDSTCTSAWGIFELIAKRFVDTTVDDEGNEITTVRNCDAIQTRAILHWLALFNTAEVPETTLRSCLETDIVMCASRALHFQCLKQPDPTRSAPTMVRGREDDQSDRSLSLYQQRHLQLLQEQAEHLSSSLASSSSGTGADDKTKGFDKLPSITKATILAFLSVDGETPATDIDQVGKDIFLGKNDYEKTKILEVHLRKEGVTGISLSIAQSKDLVNGHWTWKNLNTPSGFSFVLFSQSDPLSGISTSDEIRYLSLKTKKEIDMNSLQKMTETDITIPSDEHGIIACVQSGTSCLKCFKEEALVVRNLEAFLLDLYMNKHLLRIACLKDPGFPTALLCAIDRRVCTYLSHCELNPQDISSISKELINFKDITLSLQQGTFLFTDIPSAIKSVRPHTPPASPVSKRQKTKKEKKEVVENTHADPSLLCENKDDYAKIFGKSSMLHLRPRDICIRWHIKGYCFSNCANAKHHKPLTADKKGELLAFMTRCTNQSS